MSREQEEKKDRMNAWFLTGGTMLTILVLCIKIAWTMPDPPLGERFVAVSMADYGSSTQGSGSQESENPSDSEEMEQEEAASEAQPVESSVAEEIVTQEEAPSSVPTSPSETSSQEAPKEDPVEEPKVTDKLNSLFDKMGDSGGSSGDGDSDVTGNEGTNDGKIDGSGVVAGNGTGVNGFLEGRSFMGVPSVGEPQESGRVVVDVYVNREGKVTSAKANPSKSNTSSGHLYKLAEQAAMKATFSGKGDAGFTEKGTITFVFQLH